MLKIALKVGYAFAAMFVVALTGSTIVTRINFAPNDACVGNERLLANSLIQYAQDYDERLPPMTNASVVDAKLAPYATQGTSEFICPVTGAPYTPNSVIGYATLTQFDDPGAVPIFQDAVRHPYGQFTVAYLDASVRYGGTLQGDPEALCVQRAKALALGVQQYVEDYDETFPPMNSQPAFEKAVLPYVKNPQTFICPVTGLAYQPNGSLSHVTLASIKSPNTTVLLYDPEVHPDGIRTIAYADGHAVHGKEIAPQATDIGNIKQLGIAINQYSQDYDESLPPFDTYSHFEQALLPYTNNNFALFQSPDTGLQYKINSSLNGLNLQDISDPSSTWVTEDALPDAAGNYTIGYLDGHAKSSFSYYPATLVNGPDFHPALVWLESPNSSSALPTTQNMQVWDLSALGNHASTVTYTLTGPFLGRGAISQIATITGDQRLVTGGFANNIGTTVPSGRISVSGTGTAGTITSTFDYGPFDGWEFLANSASRTYGNKILARRYDGTLGLLAVSSTGAYQTSHTLPSSTSQTPVGFVASTDGTIWILLSDSNGTTELWRTNQLGVVLSKYMYSNGSAQPVELAINTVGCPVILWNGAHGTAQAWVIGQKGSIGSIASMSVPAQWTVSQIGVNSAGNYIILWTAPGDYAAIQCVKPNGAVVSSYTYAPFQ
jgi:hypothetical protein